MSYDEVVEKLKSVIMEASLSEGKLVNPLNSGNEKITDIICTWGQIFKAMEYAEKEWNEMKSKDSVFLNLRHERMMEILAGNV